MRAILPSVPFEAVRFALDGGTLRYYLAFAAALQCQVTIMRWSIADLCLTAILVARGELHAQEVSIPSDIGVTLVATTPTANLVTGQLVDLTLTVTNYGPDPAPYLAVSSSIWQNEVEVTSVDLNECFLILSVYDGVKPGYQLTWYIAGGTEPPFPAGQTVVCHFSIELTRFAPATTTFSFAVPSYFGDINPANDVGAVVLQRAPSPIPVSVLTLILLIGIMIVAAGTRLTPQSSRPLRWG